MLLLLADIQETRKAFVCLNVWPLSDIDTHFAVEHVCVDVIWDIYNIPVPRDIHCKLFPLSSVVLS